MFESKTSDVVKLVDFGTACRFDPSRPLQSQVGSLPGMAPEVFARRYSSQCDLWSVGVVAFQLLSDQPPFQAPNPIALMTKIGNVEYTFESKSWADKSNLSRGFCKSLLVKDPTVRLTAKKALDHDWIATSPIDSPLSNEAKSLLRKHMELYSTAPQYVKMARVVMARRSDPQEVAFLRALFESCDKQRTGRVTTEELGSAFGDGALARSFDGVGIFSDKEISYSEFLGSLLKLNEHSAQDRIAEAFEALNVDGRRSESYGNISLDNLLEECKKLDNELYE